MSWDVDYTSVYRADVVGLDPDVSNALTDLVMRWLDQGPSRQHARNIGGMRLYEEVVARRYLLAYVVDEERQKFALLWLRERPGFHRKD